MSRSLPGLKQSNISESRVPADSRTAFVTMAAKCADTKTDCSKKAILKNQTGPEAGGPSIARCQGQTSAEISNGTRVLLWQPGTRPDITAASGCNPDV